MMFAVEAGKSLTAAILIVLLILALSPVLRPLWEMMTN